MRLLYARHADDAARIPARQSRPDRTGSPHRDFRQSLPLHRLSGHCCGGSRRGGAFKGGQGSSVTSRTFGNRVGRIEDPALLTGKGRFIDDIKWPDLAHAAFVRSPHGHASIVGIDTSAALDVPGVFAVFTAADFAPLLKIDR